MGNDPSRPLMDLIGEFDPNKWSESHVWSCMHIADKESVIKLLANQQKFTLTQMMNGTVTVEDIVSSTTTTPTTNNNNNIIPDALSPKSSSKIVTLWKLNRHHKSVNGDKGIANLACWLATAGNRERSKWMHPGGCSNLFSSSSSSSASFVNTNNTTSNNLLQQAEQRDLLSLPGRNCHVIRFHRGEPFEAFQKMIGFDIELAPGGAAIDNSSSPSAINNNNNNTVAASTPNSQKTMNTADAGKIDLYLSSLGLYAPLLFYDHRICDSSTKFYRCSLAPPQAPGLSSMCTSELLLGLVDICFGLSYLHQDSPLSPAAKCAHNNVNWSSIYIRTDANGNRLPWVLFDPRYTRIEHQQGLPNAFVRTQKEREFGAPEIVNSEFNDDFLCSGDVYSFGRMIDSVLPKSGNEASTSSQQQQTSSSSSSSSSLPPDLELSRAVVNNIQNNFVISNARKELEKFVSLTQTGDLNRRPQISQFLKLSCVQNCAFVRLMRMLDYFFPWHLLHQNGATSLEDSFVASCGDDVFEEEIFDNDDQEELKSLLLRQKNKRRNHNKKDNKEQQQRHDEENLAEGNHDDQDNDDDHDDDDDDVEQFALDVAFGVSPRQLPSSILVRIKTLFFATLHMECLKIPNELFMRRVVPRVLDHVVFCSGAASPFLWQLLTPMKQEDPPKASPHQQGTSKHFTPLVLYPLPSSSSLIITKNSKSSSSSSSIYIPTCGLLHPNDLRNALLAFIETASLLPQFAIESDHLRREILTKQLVQSQQQTSPSLSSSPTTSTSTSTSRQAMFIRKENSLLSHRIATSKHTHKIVFLLRSFDLLVQQMLSLDLLAKMLVPFVASCFSTSTEFIIRAAVISLKSVLALTWEKQQNVKNNISSSSSSQKKKKRNKRRKSNKNKNSDNVEDNDDEEDDSKSDDDENDDDEEDERWQFIQGLCFRSLLMCAQLALNESSEPETRIACFDICVVAVNEFELFVDQLLPKLIAVAQKIIASPSSSSSSPNNRNNNNNRIRGESTLKLAAIEFLYDQFNHNNNNNEDDENQNHKLIFGAEMLPFCLAAAQNPTNSGDVRTLSAKIICILLNWCEKEQENRHRMFSSTSKHLHHHQEQENQMIISMKTLADRWDASSFISSSSSSASPSAAAASFSKNNSKSINLYADVKSVGRNFKGENFFNLVSMYSAKIDQEGTQNDTEKVKLTSRTTLPPQGCPLRRIVAMFPSAKMTNNNNNNNNNTNNNNKSTKSSLSQQQQQQQSNPSTVPNFLIKFPNWIANDIDQKLNMMNLLNARECFRSFSEREPADPSSIRAHNLANKLPTRVAAVTASVTMMSMSTTNTAPNKIIATTANEKISNTNNNNIVVAHHIDHSNKQDEETTSPILTANSVSPAGTAAKFDLLGGMSSATERRNKRKLQQQQQQQSPEKNTPEHQQHDMMTHSHQDIEKNNQEGSAADTVVPSIATATATATTATSGAAGGVLKRKRLAVAEAENEAALEIAQKQQEEKDKLRKIQQEQQQQQEMESRLQHEAKELFEQEQQRQQQQQQQLQQEENIRKQQQQQHQDPTASAGQKPGAKVSAAAAASAVPKRRRIGGGSMIVPESQNNNNLSSPSRAVITANSVTNANDNNNNSNALEDAMDDL